VRRALVRWELAAGEIRAAKTVTYLDFLFEVQLSGEDGRTAGETRPLLTGFCWRRAT